ncbi:MAG: beta-galactosidase trimerization domain-containing protein [Verrucomicrobiales bacterium]|nr:beta-galactosidase trimerization domain-containing protein [Verrucomicrobiales bacterium]
MNNRTATTDPTATPFNNWYGRKFNRILVDMHIPDWDDRFLSRLTPKRFVDTIVKGGGEIIMVYACSHMGLSLYPSRYGRVNRIIGDQDYTGEVLRLARKKNLDVVVYYSVNVNNAVFLDQPDWRLVPPQGESLYEHSRYGVLCPNSPYKQYALAQVEELCRRYEFDGIFCDMLFWAYPCYCRHCEERYHRETGFAKIPATVDWNNPAWVAYQAGRERWMKEIAGDLYAKVKQVRPSMSVSHQASPVLHDWRVAMPFSIFECMDYPSGDFYGPPVQQSVACKIFDALTVHKPYEIVTSRSLDLRDHVTCKQPWEMEAQAFLTRAHSAGFMFIDAIDPDGTLHPWVYKNFRDIFAKMKPYDQYLGGDLSADVAVYISSESRFDFRENGGDINETSKRADNMVTAYAGQHMAAVMGAAQALQEAHIPYAAVTKRNLGNLNRYRVIVLPNVLLMNDEEVQAFRDYVANGGALYASGYSSLVAANGEMRGDFALADVFGVSGHGHLNHELSFFEPLTANLKKAIAPQETIIHKTGRMNIQVATAKPVSRLYEAWCPENHGSVFRNSFTSIHSTPPALEPSGVAMTQHRFGKGKVYYSAGAIEAERQHINKDLFVTLIRDLLKSPAQVEAEAPSFVEVTVFDKTDEQKLNVSLVTLKQNEAPVPCEGAVSVRPGKGKKIVAVRHLPSRKRVAISVIPGGIKFNFKDFTVFDLFEVEYKTSAKK